VDLNLAGNPKQVSHALTITGLSPIGYYNVEIVVQEAEGGVPHQLIKHP
jgi:hypothetical protein